MRKYLCFCLWLLLFVLISISPGFAAKQGKEKVDSLLGRLAIHKTDDTAKIALYRDIAFEYYGIDPKIGNSIWRKRDRISEQLNYRKGLIFCLISTGVCYWASSNFPKALELLLKALKIAEEEGNRTGISKACANIGSVYADEKDYTKALEYYFKALKISRKWAIKEG